MSFKVAEKPPQKTETTTVILLTNFEPRVVETPSVFCNEKRREDGCYQQLPQKRLFRSDFFREMRYLVRSFL